MSKKEKRVSPQRHVIHLTRKGEALPMFRIVVGDYDSPKIHLEWCRADCMGNPAWAAVEPGEAPQEAGLKILALEVIGLLGRPPWIKLPHSEGECSVVGNTKVMEIGCSWGELPRNWAPNRPTIRVIHVESMDKNGYDKTLRHFSHLEVLTEDALMQPSWVYCSTNHDYRYDQKGTQMLEHLVENYITLIGARFGEEDHRQALYGAHVVRPSIYAACTCGCTHSDEDYETLIGCRLCGNFIGSAQ